MIECVECVECGMTRTKFVQRLCRQRTDARRVAYNDAFVILRDALHLIDRIERGL